MKTASTAALILAVALSARAAAVLALPPAGAGGEASPGTAFSSGAAAPAGEPTRYSGSHAPSVHLGFRREAGDGPFAQSSALGDAARRDDGRPLPGTDTVVTFSGRYAARGYDGYGNPRRIWPYHMVGNAPERGGTTHIRNAIIPVSVDMRNADGSPAYAKDPQGNPTVRLFMDATTHVPEFLASPYFARTWYPSSDRPTQFFDALLRAEFWERAAQDWHTILDPVVVTPRVIQVYPGSYQYQLNSDGTCCLFSVLTWGAVGAAIWPSTIPADHSTVLGAAELDGDISQHDITTLLFPDAYLGDSAASVGGGFHAWDWEPGDASSGYLQKLYVFNYVSWFTPGVFTPPDNPAGLEGSVVFSHEMSELLHDPFAFYSDPILGDMTNWTPWWRSPNGECAPLLETGDPVDSLANMSHPIVIKGRTYYVENQVMLPWFEDRPESNALGGAYSFPDPSVVTQRHGLQNPFCAP